MSSTTEKIAAGLFCWADLGSSDAESSKKFYQGLFGFTCQDMPMPQGSYSMLFQEGKSACALYQRGPQDTHQMAWLPYVMVDNCDDTVAKAKGLGAEVAMAGHDVPGAGRMAILIDPTGAHFALWQPTGHGGHGAKGLTGSMCWNELLTKDVTKAVAFYSKLFGWGAQEQEAGPMKVHILTQGENWVGDILALPEMMQAAPSHWLTYFQVPDLETWKKKAEELGAQIRLPRMDLPFGSFSVVADPQGAMLALWEGKSQP